MQKQTIPIRETMRSQWNGNSGNEKKRDGGAATQRRAGTVGKQAAQGKGEKEAKAVQTSNTPGRIRARETFSGNGCAFYSP